MTENSISKSHPSMYFIAQVENKFKEYIPSAKVISTTPTKLNLEKNK